MSSRNTAEISRTTFVTHAESEPVTLLMVDDEVEVTYEETEGDGRWWSRGFDLNVVTGELSEAEIAVSVPADARVTDVVAFMCQDPYPIGRDRGHTSFEPISFDRRGIPFGRGHISPVRVRRDEAAGLVTYLCTFSNWARDKNRYAKLRVYYEIPFLDDWGR